MEEITTREKVLKRIRAALLSKSQHPFPKVSMDSPVFDQTDEDPLILFAERCTDAGARFFLIESELEFAEAIVNLGLQHKWKDIFCVEDGLSNLLTECEFPHHVQVENLDQMEVGISTCECLVARTGSVILSSKEQTRSIPAVAPIHIVLGKSSQLALDLKDAVSWLKHKYNRLPSSISIITGPSRTADIEGTLVTGAHGPEQLYVFVIDDRTGTK